MIYLFGLTYDIYSFASPWHVSRLGNGKTAITAVEIRIHFYYLPCVVLFNLRMFNKSSDRDDVRLPMLVCWLVNFTTGIPIETELRKAERTVGVHCYIFSIISSGTG